MVNSHCKLHKKTDVLWEGGVPNQRNYFPFVLPLPMCVALCPNSCFKLTKIYNLLWVSNYQKCQLFCGKLWYFRCVSIFITNAFYGKTHGCHLSLYPWVLPWNYGKGHYMAKPIHYDFCHGIWLLPYVYDFSHGIPYYGLDSRWHSDQGHINSFT